MEAKRRGLPNRQAAAGGGLCQRCGNISLGVACSEQQDRQR